MGAFSKAAFSLIKHGFRLPRGHTFETFRQHTRTIDEIKRRHINVVLDVGANRGFYSEHLRELGYKGLILAFEPVRECFEELARRAASDPDWRVFNCALGEKPGTIDFNVVKVGDGELVLSSALTPKMDLPTTKTVVPVRTVKDVLATEVKISAPRVFLKMDTQGYDLNVFQGAENTPEIKLLLSEVSATESYENMPLYPEVMTAYADAGFSLLDVYVCRAAGPDTIGEMDVLLGRA